MENPDTERIKCSWNDDKRFVWISKTATVTQLHQAISDKYNLPVEVGQIKFRDPTEPNDLMTLSSQEDMEIFFSSHYKEVFITRQTPPLSPNFTHRYSLNSNPELMGHKLCRCSPLFFDFANSYNTESPPWIIHSSELRIPVDTPPLGCGYFGEVRLGYWRRRKVACKKVFDKYFSNKSDFEIFYGEVKLLSEMRHPNVVMFLGACVDSKEKIIVTEYCEGGNLFSLLKKEEIEPTTQLKIAKDVALGMNYLHFENVIHRDLNSSNILLSLSKEAKVSDFGLSRKLDYGSIALKEVGTMAWAAPEVLIRQENYTTKADVYSYGMILWELLHDGANPYSNKNELETLRAIHTGEKPQVKNINSVEPNFLALLNQCWSNEKQDRPSFLTFL
jgi:hypothetical protein